MSAEKMSIVLKCWDKDNAFTKDDFIGKYEIKLNQMKCEPSHPQQGLVLDSWVKLQDLKGDTPGDLGELKVKVELIFAGDKFEKARTGRMAELYSLNALRWRPLASNPKSVTLGFGTFQERGSAAVHPCPRCGPPSMSLRTTPKQSRQSASARSDRTAGEQALHVNGTEWTLLTVPTSIAGRQSGEGER